MTNQLSTAYFAWIKYILNQFDIETNEYGRESICFEVHSYVHVTHHEAQFHFRFFYDIRLKRDFAYCLPASYKKIKIVLIEEIMKLKTICGFAIDILINRKRIIK
jgi:hypothetical protein